MNGAVHGDAITTASTPDSAAFAYWLCAVHPAADDGTRVANSKTPDRLSASTKNRMARLVTTAGDWSWKPHPNCSPAARNASRAPASARKVKITPAPKLKPSRRKCFLLPWPGLVSDSAFSESTGNTQGMRFSTSPPTNASKSACTSQSDSAACAGATLSAGAAPATGFGPAVTAPTNGASSAIART